MVDQYQFQYYENIVRCCVRHIRKENTELYNELCLSCLISEEEVYRVLCSYDYRQVRTITPAFAAEVCREKLHDVVSKLTVERFIIKDVLFLRNAVSFKILFGCYVLDGVQKSLLNIILGEQLAKAEYNLVLQYIDSGCDWSRVSSVGGSGTTRYYRILVNRASKIWYSCIIHGQVLLKSEDKVKDCEESTVTTDDLFAKLQTLPMYKKVSKQGYEILITTYSSRQQEISDAVDGILSDSEQYEIPKDILGFFMLLDLFATKSTTEIVSFICCKYKKETGLFTLPHTVMENALKDLSEIELGNVLLYYLLGYDLKHIRTATNRKRNRNCYGISRLKDLVHREANIYSAQSGDAVLRSESLKNYTRLNNNTLNALFRASEEGNLTVGEFIDLTEEQLSTMRCIGKDAIKAIQSEQERMRAEYRFKEE